MGVRFGEAMHPGPESQDQQSTFAIGTFNPTGLVGKGDTIQDMPHGLWGASETHMTSVGYHKLVQELKFRQSKIKVVHGHFAPPVSSNVSSYGGKATGVAVLASTPLRQLTHEWPVDVWETSRLVACSTLIGNTWVKMGVAYGYAKDPHLPSTIASTDRILACLTDRLVYQSYGCRVIAGDFNHSRNIMPQFDLWRKEGWVEIQEYAWEKWKVPIKPTYRGKSVIDMVWISPEMVPYLEQVTVDPSYYADHAVVFGRFTFPKKPAATPVWRKPMPIQWDQVPEGTFCLNMPDLTDADAALQHLFAQVEQHVDTQLKKTTGHGLLPQQRGRCLTQRPHIKHHEVTPIRPPVKGSPSIGFHGENFTYTKWVRQLRRLDSLRKGLAVPNPSSAHASHLSDLWQSIRAAPGFPHGFPKAWHSRATVLPNSPVTLPRKVPSKATADVIYASFEADFRAFEKLLKQNRTTRAVQRRAQDPNVVFKDVKKAQSLPVQTVVLKKKAEVTEVDTQLNVIKYTPLTLDIQEPVVASAGMLAVQSHDPGVITLSTVPGIEIGDLLVQDQVVADLPGLFQAFHDLWHPIWNRHQGLPKEAWDEQIRQLNSTPPMVTVTLEFPLVDLESWDQMVRSKKPHSATGPDGVSRVDLIKMPPEARQCLVDLFGGIDRREIPWPSSLLVGHITAIEKHGAAAQPHEYRPICVLPVAYRVWASGKAKTILQWLDRHQPATMIGNRPGYCTMDIWYQLALLVEQAAYWPETHCTGLVTDVCKCFNTLPRALVYVCARRCGIPASFLEVWFQAISKVTRHFVVAGGCSPPLLSETGFPEGDPLSVVAMACVNFQMHHDLQSSQLEGTIISYVDNWEAVSNTPSATLRVWDQLQAFSKTMDITLDAKKTYTWATASADRKTLRSGPVPVKLDGRDLGAHMHYSKRRTMYTIRDRIGTAQALWGGIARSLAPLTQKLRLLPSVAWARCFHGSAIVPLGDDHANRLRSKAMQALRWDKKGASPWIQFSLVEDPTHDPGFHIVWSTILAFRRLVDFDVPFAILDKLCQEPSKNMAPGPCSLLLTRIHVLGWSWLGNGWCQDHFGMVFDIVAAPQQFLASLAKQAWTMHVGSIMDVRATFEGLKHVDRAFSMEEKTSWSDEKAAVLRTASNGTFFTRDKQYHSGKFQCKTCPWCESEDSIFHRYWECPFFHDLRKQLPLDDVGSLLAMPPCTHLHGWFPFTDLALRWEQTRELLQDCTMCFEPTIPMDHDVHFFIDGGCHGRSTFTKLGTWAVAVANLHTADFAPIAQGFLPGRLRTSVRAELTALCVALAVGLHLNRPFSVWTDCQAIFDKINRWMRATTWPSLTHQHKNADLWKVVLRRLQAAVANNLFQSVFKVRSHQEATQYSDLVDRWAIEGNNFVDAMTNRVLQTIPSELQLVWQARQEEITKLRRLRNLLRQYMYDVGMRAITHRSQAHTVEPMPPTNTGSRAPVDSRLSIAPLPDRLPAGTWPKSFSAHCEDMFQWLHTLQAGDDACNNWLSSYQLLVHYQLTTGRVGYLFQNRGYHVVSDPECPAYTFIKGAGWFVSLLKVMCTHWGLPYITSNKVPAGVSFNSWRRCILVRVNPATVQMIDHRLAAHGVRQIRKISSAFSHVRGFWDVP
eukprot:Skav207080  [mRNA]  locus=scaffold1909:525523:530421:+ [translate_table: standard]